MEPITSVKNPVIQSLRALKDRRARIETGHMLIEGEKLIAEALDAGLPFTRALVATPKLELYSALISRLSAQGAQIIDVPPRLVDAACDTVSPQGICAECALPAPLSESALPALLVALDGVQDPGNVGAIWRTADASGFGGIILGAGCADPFGPKVQRAAMGAGFRVPAAAPDSLHDWLAARKAEGYRVAATMLSGQDFYDYTPPAKFILVIGGEARGISAEVQALSDQALTLPMRGGAESLNASVAAGIMMYHLSRRFAEGGLSNGQ